MYAAGQAEGFAELHPSDRLASGVLHSVVEIQSDDAQLRDDDKVGVRFVAEDGDAADTMGGYLAGGALTTNRVHTSSLPPARSMLRVPLFAGQEPVVLQLAATELGLQPDQRGGFDGVLAGAVDNRAGAVLHALAKPFERAMAYHPEKVGLVYSTADSDRNGIIDDAEMAKSQLIADYTHSDLPLFDAGGRFAPHAAGPTNDSFSVGVRLHLTPCSDDACTPPTVDASCFDGVKNGDEIDIDCGGSCGICQAGQVCRVDGDCRSRCVDGHCAAPTCSDGLADGVEGGVDCGWGCATACPLGGGCIDGNNCQSGSCTMGTCTAR